MCVYSPMRRVRRKTGCLPMFNSNSKKNLAIALVLAGAFFFLPAAAPAQFTTVTGTVTDPNGIPYAAGTMSAILVPGSAGGWRLSGQPYSGRVGPVTLDSAGKFTANFGSVTLITPASQWLITVNSNTGGIPAPLGTGGQTFTITTSGTTISGNSPGDISATLNAAAPKLTNFAAAARSVTGTGVASQVAFFSGANAIAGDPQWTWDNVNERMIVGPPKASFNTLSQSFLDT